MNKKNLITQILLCVALSMAAQPVPSSKRAAGDKRDASSFKLYVYQDQDLGKRFAAYWSEQVEALEANDQNQRGLLSDAFATLLSTGSGMVYSSLTGLVSTGINLVGNMVKSKKGEWMKQVQNENRFEKTLMTMQNLDDFYSTISTTSALDPSNIVFNGFGCHQKRGDETVFYLSCHLDTTQQAFSRIFRHSKFQLRVDTLLFNPQLCDLPNDSSVLFSERRPFSFEERSNLSLNVDVSISSSWINQAIQVHDNQQLGTFSLKVPINEDQLHDGMFRFIRGHEGNSVKDIQMQGECFIVPRSYVGVRDNEGNYNDAWGTGQYKVIMKVKESCSMSPQMLQGNRWKEDWKLKKAQKKAHKKPVNIFSSVKQVWDKNASQWIVTLLEAPTQQMVNTMLNDVGIQAASTAGGAKTGQGQGKGQGQSGMTPQQGAGKPQQGGGSQTGNQPNGGGRP